MHDTDTHRSRPPIYAPEFSLPILKYHTIPLQLPAAPPKIPTNLYTPNATHPDGFDEIPFHGSGSKRA